MNAGLPSAGAFVAVLALVTATTQDVNARQAPAPTQQAPPVFRAGADIVRVDVSVVRDRRPVPGLTAADFELLDNGVPQEIAEVAYERLPIDLTMLLDVSASVTGDVLEELRRAVRQLHGDLRSGDRLRLLTFNMRVSRLVDFGEPDTAIDDALRSVRGGGSSAVFDSLAVALTAADTPGRRRFIVLFSDGQDSSSITDTRTLLEVVRRSSPTVAVVLGPSSGARPASLLRTGSDPALTAAELSNQLARESGGVVTTVKPGESLSARFRRILQDFRSSYVLYFAPRGVDRAGTHTLDVRVRRAGMEVRARRAYVWR